MTLFQKTEAKKIFSRSILRAGAIASFFLPVVSLAQTGTFWQPPSGVTVPITSVDQLEGILKLILKWMFGVFMILAVIFIIWAAFLYLTAAGNEQNVKKAKQQLVYAVIAIVIALMASGFEQVLLDLLQGE